MITYQFSDQITIDWLVKNIPQFLFPDLSKQQTRIQKPFIGVLAINNRQPIGLILASSALTQANYRIHSFLVHPSYFFVSANNFIQAQFFIAEDEKVLF